MCDDCNKIIKLCCNCKEYKSKYAQVYGEGYWCEECFKTVAVATSHLKYTEKNREEWIECLECGYRLKDLNSHIKYVHNLDSNEYKRKHEIKRITSINAINRVSGENNPGFNHCGRLSPFSKNFKYYTNEEDRQAIFDKAANTIKNNDNISTTLVYFLKKTNGNVELAQKMLSERQTTFSIEKCIKKYGEIDGKLKWQERQNKWQDTLNGKSDEEKLRINRLKTAKGYSISKAEIEICNVLGLHESSQLCIDPNKGYVYDIVINKKIIEYNGDYWHMNPSKYDSQDFNKRTNLTAKETWEKDKAKIDFAKSLGYEILTIWEYDYKQDKEAVIQKCINFLTQ